MSSYEDIVIKQGTDYAMQIEVANVDGSKKDLTDYTINSQLRKTINTTDSDAITFTSSIPTPATDGLITLELTNAQTSAMAPGRYLYDVNIEYTDSDLNTVVERILEGQANVTASITRI